MFKNYFLKTAFQLAGGREFEEENELDQTVNSIQKDDFQKSNAEAIEKIKQDASLHALKVENIFHAQEKQIQEELVQQQKEIQEEFEKRILALEEIVEAKRRYNQQMAVVNQNAINNGLENSIGMVNSLQGLDTQANAGINAIQQKQQMDMDNIPPSSLEQIEQEPAKLQEKAMMAEQEKQMQLMQSQQAQQMMNQADPNYEAMMQQTQRNQDVGGPMAPQQNNREVNSAMMSEANGGLDQTMSVGQKQASSKIKHFFAFPEERRFPLFTQKLAVDSIKASRRSGFNYEADIVFKKACENFPSLFLKKSTEIKVSKIESGYVGISPQDRENCGRCVFFSSSEFTCKKVDGNISAAGWCKKFEPR